MLRVVSLPIFILFSKCFFAAERLSTVLTIVGEGAVGIGITSVESLLRSGCLFGCGDDIVYPFGEGEEGRRCRGYIAGGGGNGASEGSESHRGEGQSEEVDHLVTE